MRLYKKFGLRVCLLWSLLFAWAASLSANPVISGAANISPLILGGGDVATFTFSFTNANTPESSSMTSSQLEFQPPSVSVNGVSKYVGLVSVTAPGGAIDWVMDGGGQVTGVTVAYAGLAKGATRTFTATLQLPEGGLRNTSTLSPAATLTWPESPGLLARDANASLQVSPLLQVALGPVPPAAAPGGFIEYRAEYQNTGDGIAHKAWIVIPVHPDTRLVQVAAGPARPPVWFSTTAYPLAQANSDAFIKGHFQMGILNDGGSPGDPSNDFWNIPSGTRMIAVFLDDPEVNLFPSGLGIQELVWRVQDDGSDIGTLIEQPFGYFADEVAFVAGEPRVTKIQLLPADLKVVRAGASFLLIFTGEAGALYHIQRSDDLKAWPDIGGALEVNPGLFQFTDSNPLPTRAFYRVVQITPP